MTDDDTKDQIPLFDPPPAVEPGAVTHEPAPVKQPEKANKPQSPAPRGTKGKKDNPAARKAAAPKAVSGLVPEGDVRLTANIRQDLHLRLKIAAAHRRTTIGEIIEELVEKHVK